MINLVTQEIVSRLNDIHIVDRSECCGATLWSDDNQIIICNKCKEKI